MLRVFQGLFTNDGYGHKINFLSYQNICGHSVLAQVQDLKHFHDILQKFRINVNFLKI